MSRVVHFEIHASNPESCIAFYTALFGWTIEPWGPPGYYWTVVTGSADQEGINGGIVPRRGAAPVDGQGVNAFACTVNVPSVDAALSRAVDLGGTVAAPKMAIPTVGWLGYAKDTEGNIFGVMQDDPSAA